MISALSMAYSSLIGTIKHFQFHHRKCNKELTIKSDLNGFLYEQIGFVTIKFLKWGFKCSLTSYLNFILEDFHRRRVGVTVIHMGIN